MNLNVGCQHAHCALCIGKSITCDASANIMPVPKFFSCMYKPFSFESRERTCTTLIHSFVPLNDNYARDANKVEKTTHTHKANYNNFSRKSIRNQCVDRIS